MKSIHIHNTEPNNGHKDHQQVHAKKKKRKKKKAASQISTRQSSSEKTCYFSTHYRHLGAILFPLSSRVRGAFSAGNVRATNCCLPRRRVVKKHWGSGYFRCLLWLVALCICCFSPSRSLSLSLILSQSHTLKHTCMHMHSGRCVPLGTGLRLAGLLLLVFPHQRRVILMEPDTHYPAATQPVR